METAPSLLAAEGSWIGSDARLPGDEYVLVEPLAELSAGFGLEGFGAGEFVMAFLGSESKFVPGSA
jgi:hypothetical protein